MAKQWGEITGHAHGGKLPIVPTTSSMMALAESFNERHPVGSTVWAYFVIPVGKEGGFCRTIPVTVSRPAKYDVSYSPLRPGTRHYSGIHLGIADIGKTGIGRNYHRLALEHIAADQN